MRFLDSERKLGLLIKLMCNVFIGNFNGIHIIKVFTVIYMVINAQMYNYLFNLKGVFCIKMKHTHTVI